MKDIIFWGGTGQARVLREAIAGSDFNLIACFDNKAIESPFSDIPIYIGPDGFDLWKNEHSSVSNIMAATAIGGSRGEERLDIQEWLVKNGLSAATIIHKTAFIASDATIGEGSQILAMSAVCANAAVGKACIINTAASVDHCCRIGDGVHIAPGARLAGEVIVEDFAFIGTGAIILPGIKIGFKAIIGAGSVVTKNIPPHATVAGNPAHLIK